PTPVVLRAIKRTPPPAIAEQREEIHDDAWRVTLTASPPAPPAVATLTAAVFADAPGDCTAHALAFIARAERRGLETRAVTGWRLDGGRLVRHRWALVRQADGPWIAVDPSYGEAPASPRLIGLAVGGATTAELAAADLAFVA